MPLPDTDANLLLATFEATPQALLVCDAQGIVRLANAAALALTGQSKAQLLGRSVDLLLPVALAAGHAVLRQGWFQRPVARTMAAGRLLTCRHADGSEFPVEIRLCPLLDGAQRLVLAALVDLRARQVLERRFELAVAAAPVAMLMLDEHARIVASNQACERLFGYTSDELSGLPLERLLPAARPHRTSFLQRLHLPCRLGARRPLRGRRRDGAPLPLEMGLSRVPNSTPALYLVVLNDLTEHRRLAAAARQAHEELEERVRERTLALEQANREREALLKDLLIQREVLEHLSREDALTGLANRRAFDEQLLSEARRAIERGLPLALAMLDLDHFKDINDRFGHALGDEVLRICATLLRRQSRTEDLLARYGGEEFVWAMPGVGLEAACRRCELLRASVAGFDWNRIRPGLVVTLSAGVATLSAGLDPAALLALADARLYAAKRAGRNRIEPPADCV